MKEKFIVIECIEREISILGITDDLEAAQKIMLDGFNRFHVTENGIDIEEYDIDDEYGIEKESAWSNIINDFNADWKIEKIEL